VGIYALGYDYDEVMRAHSSWLAAQGLRPYRDFLDCHPPYFRMLAPVVRASAGDPCAVLWSLRILSATGNLLFLGGLAALGASRVQSGTWSALFGLAIVAFQPTVLHYLVEFRIDGWGYALAVWSIYRFRRDSRGGYREFKLGLLTGIATLLFCPKLAILPPLIILSDQIVARASARSAVRAMVAYLGGAGIAAVLFALYLTWQGIDFDQTFQPLVRYNAISNVNLGIHLGLLQSILASRLLCCTILAGMLVAGVDFFRHRARPDTYQVALVAWLILQAILVAYPHSTHADSTRSASWRNYRAIGGMSPSIGFVRSSTFMRLRSSSCRAIGGSFLIQNDRGRLLAASCAGAVTRRFTLETHGSRCGLIASNRRNQAAC
jgi:hypothetical protein